MSGWAPCEPTRPRPPRTVGELRAWLGERPLRELSAVLVELRSRVRHRQLSAQLERHPSRLLPPPIAAAVGRAFVLVEVAGWPAERRPGEQAAAELRAAAMRATGQ